MLKNIVNQEEMENRRQFPKNNFFCYKWRVVDNFNRSIDRQMFQLAVHGADNHRSLMNHKMLQLHKSRYSGSRRDLVMNLAHDAMDFLTNRRIEQSNSSKEQIRYCSAMLNQMEHTFNLLLSFATELNTILGLSELFITATEPDMEIKDKTKETVLSFAQARFSTSYYSLVVEGRRERINFYIIPADELISLEDVGLQYQSIARWNAVINKDGSVDWTTEGFNITSDVHEVFCIQLLGQLIEKTKERIAPKEKEEKAKAQFNFVEPDPWTQTAKLSTDESVNEGSFTETAIPEKPASQPSDEWRIIDSTPANPLEDGSGIFAVETPEFQPAKNAKKQSRRKRRKKSRR